MKRLLNLIATSELAARITAAIAVAAMVIVATR